MDKRTWRDVDELALDLARHFPALDPLTLSLSELRTLVVKLPSFSDKPEAVSEKTLEAIQAAWYEEYEA